MDGTGPASLSTATLPSTKFTDPETTATGERRAVVGLEKLRTLWFNTGTLCNLTCHNCYIESSPRNDRLVYLSAAEVAVYLDEIEHERLGTDEIGFTGGEPFMNPDIIAMLRDSLSRGFRTLVLTNAMRPMMKLSEPLLALQRELGEKLTVRVSIDHYDRERHEEERGPRSWKPTIDGLKWLVDNGFTVHVAGRTMWGEEEELMRRGYARFYEELGIALDAEDPVQTVLFPEMDASDDVPEITERCWGILNVKPQDIMCASQRMVVKRKGAAQPAVVACTLLPYDARFEMGQTLREASGAIALNHPHCAKFCVLGGGSCSRS